VTRPSGDLLEEHCDHPAGSAGVDRMRVRAPELRGRGWLGTGGRELTLAGLRGRVVLLDFWTSGCVNCLHVLDELRVLEERFGDALVVLGVHSPKFAHEAEPDAVAAAVERHGVTHPVLDDADLRTWDAYAARAWPTLALVDPGGYVVAQGAGEGHGPELGALVQELLARHDVRRGGSPYVAPPEPAGALRFPGKVIALPGGAFLVSDTAHHRLVELEADLVTERRRIGDGARGLADGLAPRFAEPQGLLLLPDGDVLVADSANHALRRVRLADGRVTTEVGDGGQLRRRVAPGSSAARLSTPWDLAWWDGRVVIAMAGTHQLWTWDGQRATVLAGTADEGLRDGPPQDAFLAQPSGLATGADGALWVADAEGSALRELRGDLLTTAVGQGLFDSGHRDGPAGEALLQHPLGVAVLPDGSVAIADTYNGAVRRYDPVGRTVGTLADGLAEPSDVLVDGDALVVVESAAHRLVRLPLPASARTGAQPVRRGATDLAPGPLALRVVFTPPAGQHVDTRFGDPTQLTVTADPPGLLRAGAGTAPGLERALELAGVAGVLSISAAAAACEEGDGVFAACHRHRREWVVPVRPVPGAPAELVLDLG
jgi:thiol-disulfide isomerase/thioredoxin